jgi:hypothetical protein
MLLLGLIGQLIDAIVASSRFREARQRTLRQVARAPAATLRDLDARPPVASAVRVEGIAESSHPFACPVTAAAVLGFHVRIELSPLELHGPDRIIQRRAVEVSVVGDFTLRDEGGGAAVRGRGALLAASGGERPADQLAVDLANPAFAQYVEQEVSIVEVVGSRIERYLLHELRAGDRVSVCGRPRREIDVSGASAGYRGAPTQTVFEAAADAPLIIVSGGGK